MKTTNSDNNNSTNFAELKSKLKALYLADNTIPPLIKIDNKQEQSIDDYYVNLQMVLKEDQENATKNAASDKVGGEKEPIALEQMFDKVADSEATNKIFVLGGPGVGKTTLLHSMSYKWAHDGLWQDKFDFVIRVRLKEMLDTQKTMTYKGEDILPGFIYQCLDHQKENLFSKGIDEVPEFEFEEIKKLLSNSELRDKILLLVDGYDEVAGLKNQSASQTAYTRIIGREHLDNGKAGGIIDFKNVIMTSRPSAVDDKLLSHFERKIINNGLDVEGASKYIEKFFKDDAKNAENLKGFLSKHGTIQDMCKTPINVSLICMIWKDENIQAEIKKNIEDGSFKVGQLYEYIILNLTKRSMEKNLEHTDKSQSVKYITKAEYVFKQDIMKAIKDLAYYHFVSGDKGLDDSGSNSDQGQELISGGATGIKGDLLHKFLQKNHKEKIDIEKVVNFGLLNAEGNSKNLTENTMYFVHLTFKEYLTAYQMYEFLNSNDKKGIPSENAKLSAETISGNRNNPSYLMTLKFLAGMVCDDKSADNAAITRFWQAVSCNVDGVIELGAEEKVKLFMHLLGQSKKSNSQEVNESKAQHETKQKGKGKEKESTKDKIAKEDGVFDGRIPNLKEIQKFIDDNIEGQSLSYWKDEIITSGYLSEKIINKVKDLVNFNPKDSRINENEVKAAFDLVQKLINDKQIQANIGDKSKIFDTLSGLLKNKSVNWTIKKFCLNNLSDLSEGMDGKKLCETSKTLLSFFKDDNLKDLSVNCYAKLTSNISNPALKNSNSEALLPLLQNEDARSSAASSIGQIAASDKELAGKAIEALLPLLQDEYRYVKSSAADAICQIATSGIDKELGGKTIEALLPLLQSDNFIARSSAADAIGKIAASGIDKELAVKALEALLPVMESYNARDSAAAAIGKIAASDKELGGKALEALLPLLQYENVRDSAAAAIGKIAASDKELGGKTLEALLPLLQDADESVRDSAAGGIEEIAASGIDKELAGKALEAFLPLLKTNARDSAAAAIGKIAASDKELGGKALEALLPLLQDKYAIDSAADAIGHIAASDKELGGKAIKALLPLLQILQSDAYSARYSAAYAIGQIAASGIDKELGVQAIEALLPLLQDEYARYSAPDAIGHIAASGIDKELGGKAIEALLPLLQTNARDSAAGAIGQIAASNLELVNNKLLQNDSKDLRESLYKYLVEKIKSLEKLPSKEIVHVINIISSCESGDEGSQDLIAAGSKLLKSSIDDIAGDEKEFRKLVKVINENFNNLPNNEHNNEHSISLLKQMCHHMLEDGNIDSDETKLIIKCITKKNITATFNFNDKCLIFEGNRYEIGKKSESNFNKIVNEVIKKSSDVLAKQYKNNEPLFKNEEGSVIDVAVSDKKEILSLVRKVGSKTGGDILSNDKVLISLVHLSDHKYSQGSVDKFFVLQEYRNWVGQHMVKRIDCGGGKLKSKSFISNDKLDVTKEIFIPAEYTDDVKPRYYVCKFTLSKRAYDKLSAEINDIAENSGGLDTIDTLYKALSKYTNHLELKKQLSDFNWSNYVNSIKSSIEKKDDLFRELKLHDLTESENYINSRLHRKSQEITISELKGRMDEIDKFLELSGIRLTVELKEKLTAIKAENEDLFSYCITFIHTMDTYLNAFKMSKEDFIKTKIEENKLAKVGHHTASSLAAVIPMFGECISQPLDAAYGTYKNILTLQAKNQLESNLKVLQTILPSDQETVISRIIMKVLDNREYVEKIKSYYREDKSEGWAEKVRDLAILFGSLEDDNYTALNSVGYILDILCDLSSDAGLSGRTTDQLARDDVIKLFVHLYKQEGYLKNFNADSDEFANHAGSLVCAGNLGEHMLSMLNKLEGVYGSDYKLEVEECRADLKKISGDSRDGLLVKIGNKAAKGEWEQSRLSKGRECSEYFKETYLTELINKNNLIDRNIKSQEIKGGTEGAALKKKILSFKLLFVQEMCSAMVDKAATLSGKAKSDIVQKEAMIKCAYYLGVKYPELIKFIANQFPEFFKDQKIAEACFLYSLNKSKDDSVNNGDIGKLLKEVNYSLGNKESIFREVEVRDVITDKGWIFGKGDGGHAESNYDHWLEYYNEGMDKMLHLRLKSVGDTDTEVLKLDYVYDGSADSVEHLSSDIISNLDDIFSNASRGEAKLAIPLNLYNKHWIGMVVSKTVDGINIEYMDSEQNPIPEALKLQLNKLLSDHYENLTVSINEKEVALQNYSNCGLETIENIIEAINPGMRVYEEDVLAVHNLLMGDSLIFD